MFIRFNSDENDRAPSKGFQIHFQVNQKGNVLFTFIASFACTQNFHDSQHTTPLCLRKSLSLFGAKNFTF